MNRELIAQVAHEVNRAYCASLGDTTQPAWADAPEWQKASALVGVDMHTKNPDATPEQSHESWLAQKAADGWAWGEAKDPEKKLHPCFLPYAELPAEQKAKDYLFRGVVHAMLALPVAALAPTTPIGATTVRAAAGSQAVKYIGPRDTYVEGAYGSGIVFAKGETKLVPATLASKLLKHPDVYVEGEAADAPGGVVSVQEPGAIENEATKTQPERDAVANMNKAALETYARTHFRVELDKRKNLPDLRAQVTGLIDQFGVPAA